MGFFDVFSKKTAGAAAGEPKQVAKATDDSKARMAAQLKPEETVNAAKAGAGSELTFRLVKRPHISEKAVAMASQGTYVFEVPVTAEKIAVKKAIEGMYKVKVTRVRTVHVKGKTIYRGRRPGHRNDFKKALVTLKKGQSLDLYGGV